GDEARPTPARPHAFDQRRDPLGGWRARGADPLLLVEQPVVHALQRGAPGDRPSTRLRRLRAGQGRVQGPHPRLPIEVTPPAAPLRVRCRRVRARYRAAGRTRGPLILGGMAERATFRVKRGLAEMLKGGVIMDVTTAEQARIAEGAGAVA